MRALLFISLLVVIGVLIGGGPQSAECHPPRTLSSVRRRHFPATRQNLRKEAPQTTVLTPEQKALIKQNFFRYFTAQKAKRTRWVPKQSKKLNLVEARKRKANNDEKPKSTTAAATAATTVQSDMIQVELFDSLLTKHMPTTKSLARGGEDTCVSCLLGVASLKISLPGAFGGLTSTAACESLGYC